MHKPLALHLVKNSAIAVRYFGNGLLDFVFPNVCFQCSASISSREILICSSCLNALPRNSLHILKAGDRWLSRKKQFAFAAYRFDFNGTVKHLIHLFKYHDYHFLHEILGAEMAETARNVGELAAADCLVPVPLHRARMRERGYNQSALLARLISQKTGIPLQEALERIKNNPPQASIEDKRKKEDNVRGIFSLRKKADVGNRLVILVDDIFTTGSTANECGKILKKGGAREVYVLTAAYAGG